MYHNPSSYLWVNKGCALVILFQFRSLYIPTKTDHLYWAISWSPYRVATKSDRQNSRIIQGCFKDLFVIFKDVKTAPIRESSARCIKTKAKFKDVKDVFQNSRTFQGYSKILSKIQGPFKDFKDRH